MSTRSIGITLISLTLGWLGFGGLLFALSVPLDRLPPPVVFDGFWALALKICFFFYGLFALGSCVGLWTRRSWVRFLMRGWMASCMAMFLIFIVVVPRDLFLGGYSGAATFMIFVVGAFVMLDRYIRGYLTHAT